MTRKHFRLIAEACKRARRQNSVEQAVDHIVADLAEILKTNNPRFDVAKFVEAAE